MRASVCKSRFVLGFFVTEWTATLQWYAKTTLDTEIKEAAQRASFLLRKSIEERKAKMAVEQRTLFDDLEDDIA